MIKTGFSKNISVKYSEMDCQLALKPSALLNFLQDMASDNAEMLGFGYSFITKKNLMWFLLKYHMEFTDYPVSVYDLTLKTEPRGYAKLFAYRDFELYNGEKCLGRAASLWSLVNTDTKSLTPVGTALDNPNMPLHEKRADDLNFEKIPEIEKVDSEKVFDIRYEDIDVNQHVNNGNYIIWALEPLEFDFRCRHKIKTLDIVFKKEIKYGHKILAQIEFKDSLKTIHNVKNADTGEDLCHVQIEWTKYE